MTDFVLQTINWYRRNKRELPWRETKNPYFIWLSEVILQQTRVEQGLSYYLKFIEKYPTIENLALANEDEVLKLWQGLGYYSRARNLHATAKIVYHQHNGIFPSTLIEIEKLKGIGPYTAAAIASFAFDLPHAVVDGNVYRILSRYFGISTPIDSTEGKKEFFLLANELIPTDNPAEFNQAIMEFGGQFCTPNQPDCMNCVHFTSCVAGKTQTFSEFPVKSKKTKVRDRYFHYLYIEHNDEICFNKRGPNDVWENLYEFPLIETDSKDKPSNLEMESFELCYSTKHILSHQRIHAQFYKTKLNADFISKYLTKKRDELEEIAISRLIDKFFEQN